MRLRFTTRLSCVPVVKQIFCISFYPFPLSSADCSRAAIAIKAENELDGAEAMLVERAGEGGGPASAQPATAGEAERIAAFEASTDLGQGTATADANGAAAQPSNLSI